MERITPTRLEEVYNSISSHTIKYNYTITIDSKKTNLSEAWSLCFTALEMVPIKEFNVKVLEHLVVVERHKGKNYFPHFHGQIAVNRLLKKYELVNINEHLRRIFGRSNFIKNLENTDPLPSFINSDSTDKRDWTEYILKDVMKTQETVLDYPVMLYYKNPRFYTGD